MRLRALIGAIATAVVLAGCTTAPASAPAAPQQILTVSPGGDGDCLRATPCDLATALRTATDGSAIELASGSYGDVRLSPIERLTTFEKGITVRPAPGARPELRRLYTALANTTWQRLTVRGVVYLKPDARGTSLDRMRIVGGGVFVRSDDTTLTGNLIEDGASMDGVQIGGASGVVLEHNTVRNFNESGTTGYHADCVQLFDSSDVRIVRNSLSNCYNASIIFSGGAGKGVHDVVVESNFVSGCRTKGPSCAYGTVLDLRERSVRDVVVRNNTFLGGPARVEPLPGLVLDRNVFAYLSSCTSPITNSVVASWNRGLCGDYPAIGTNGNRVGAVAVRSLATNDLRPATVAAVRIDPAGTKPSTVRGFGGKALPANLAGAALP